MSEPEIHVALEVRSLEVDPSEITERVGLQPSRSWRRGDDKGTRTHRDNGWVLTTTPRPAWDFADPMAELLGWIEPSRKGIRDLIGSRPVSVRLSLVGYLGTDAPAIYLENGLIERIARLGLDLNVDLHLMGPSESDDVEEEEER